ncbi:helix-turn-helix transcriptional regulator [Antarcticibacterium arcticum]|uniref:Helix-turn-helix transcriptional regulator n=1 Tax=Antarcticibacterium arcticum TaxID=2585771 RepID=A0A5B8YQ14_9FLAO|nr:helix-turn-helix transcriptional regulator [Antarcticibacterium arcticum]QED37989.1 helix-turn-helix transcriptional regulator [Antarcticibacterium arcticum]
MNIKELRSKIGLSQKEFGSRLGLTSQSITKFEAGGKLTETVKKLISYEFAEFMPEEERLFSKSTAGENALKEEIKKLELERTELQHQVEQIPHLKEQISLLKRNIQSLEDQVDLYKKMLNIESQSKTA